MNRILKVLTLYLVLAGVAAHGLGFAIYLGGLELVRTPDHRQTASQRPKGPNPRVTAPAPDQLADLRAALPPWRPDLSNPLAEGEIRIGGVAVSNLADAARRLGDGDTLEIGPGVYRQGLVVGSNGVTLRGRGHVVFDGAAQAGKATLVIRGDNTLVTNIECRNVRVPDRNGACIRLEGRNLTVNGVYFHSSEQGILSGGSPGVVTIERSRFERLGKNGRAHGIYIGGGQLRIRDSLFLSAVSQGHEIKSRAESTHIERSVVASLGGDDSRLLDISNGGELIVRDSILEEGPATVNNDVIGFGLEGRGHSSPRIVLTRNVILLDGPRRARLIHRREGTPAPTMTENLIVGATATAYPGSNRIAGSRAAAQLPPYPGLPPLPGTAGDRGPSGL